MNKRLLPLALLLPAAVVLAGCRDQTPSSPAVGPPAFAKVAMGPANLEGEIGPGALYRLDLPAEWNGDLMLFAHYYVETGAPLQTWMPADFRDALLSLGFGVAQSSFSENGWAVRDGLTRTRQLRGIWRSNFGTPKNTFLAGTSMGGLIALMAAEKNPGLYEGALPMCAPVGGAPMEIEFLFNVRVLFDYFYPDVIPGDAMTIPDGLRFGPDIFPAVRDAILGNPVKAAELAGIDQIELQYQDFGELFSAIMFPIYFHFIAMRDWLDRAHSHGFFDNSGVTYTGSADDPALNAGVARFVGTPDAMNYYRHWYEPTGKLKIPALTLRTARDNALPLAHETGYADVVASAGASEMLVQRMIDRFGHCAFSVDEQVQAFLDLVAWADGGPKPSS